MKHIPVLLDEALSYLDLKPGMTVVDATLGAGGYAREIERRISPGGTLIAMDRDPNAVDRFGKTSRDPDVRRCVLQANYADVRSVLERCGAQPPHAIVADLGWSQDQIEDPSKGMSFRIDAPLDMRLDSTEAVANARDVINTASKEKLTELLREYGEVPFAGQVAAAIIRARQERPLETTTQLSDIVEGVISSGRVRRVHPATLVFQALRISVNREYEALEVFLSEAMEILADGGRMVVVSFHSGEDRRVKTFFRENARGCICPEELPICRCDNKPSLMLAKPYRLKPSPDEIQANPRARSAVLRWATKIQRL